MPAPSEARLFLGSREASLGEAASRADDIVALLASCAQRSRRPVSEPDWERVRSRDFAWNRWSPAVPVTVARRRFEVREILVPLDPSDGLAGSVLVRSDAILSPFSSCDAARIEALRQAR